MTAAARRPVMSDRHISAWHAGRPEREWCRLTLALAYVGRAAVLDDTAHAVEFARTWIAVHRKTRGLMPLDC